VDAELELVPDLDTLEQIAAEVELDALLARPPRGHPHVLLLPAVPLLQGDAGLELLPAVGAELGGEEAGQAQRAGLLFRPVAQKETISAEADGSKPQPQRYSAPPKSKEPPPG
jgi:hypothetical protein